MFRALPEDEQPAGTQSPAPFVDEHRLGLSMADRQESCR